MMIRISEIEIKSEIWMNIYPFLKEESKASVAVGNLELISIYPMLSKKKIQRKLNIGNCLCG